MVSAMGILRIVGKFHVHHHTEARSNAIDCVSYPRSNLASLDRGCRPCGPCSLNSSYEMRSKICSSGEKQGFLETSSSSLHRQPIHGDCLCQVFQKLNGLADMILMSQPPVDSWRKFIYCTSLTCRILGSVDHLLPQDFDRTVSPVSVAHFSQYKLTKLLIEQLEDIDFHSRSEGSMVFDECKLSKHAILLGHECTTINATNHRVIVTASVIREGKPVEKDFQCNFLVGTDGG